MSNRNDRKEELCCFWRDELRKAESAAAAREQGEKTWKGGTSKSWRAVGCRKTKAERLQESDREKRIGGKCRKRVEMIRATINLLSGQNDQIHP